MHSTSARTMVAAGLFVLMSSAAPPAHATSCEILTSIAHLRCEFKTDAVPGGAQSLCVNFVASSIQDEFAMVFPVDGNELLCKCAASGTLTAPKFNTSKEFLCRNYFTVFQSASGKVVGNRIKKGSFLDGNTMELFECARNPTLCP